MSKTPKNYENETLSKLSLRTRKWISDAMISLMENKTFKDITIKDIVDEADVSRQSFYRHFDSKEDVVEYYMYIHTIHDFSLLTQDHPAENLEETLTYYFQYWNDHRDFYDILIKSNYPINSLNNYEHFMKDYLHESVSKLLKSLKLTTDAHTNIILDFILGGLFNVKWHMHSRKYNSSPKEIACIIANLIENRSTKD